MFDTQQAEANSKHLQEILKLNVSYSYCENKLTALIANSSLEFLLRV